MPKKNSDQNPDTRLALPNPALPKPAVLGPTWMASPYIYEQPVRQVALAALHLEETFTQVDYADTLVNRVGLDTMLREVASGELWEAMTLLVKVREHLTKAADILIMKPDFGLDRPVGTE